MNYLINIKVVQQLLIIIIVTNLNFLNCTTEAGKMKESSAATAKAALVLIILPNKDFDVSETSIPWNHFKESNVLVHFATENGEPGEGDPILLNPVVFGMMGASDEAKRLYFQMIQSEEFKRPSRFDAVDFMEYDAVILPGGHAQGMKPYLEDKTIRSKLIPYIADKTKIVGAICHGTIVVARTIDPATGKSLLYNRRSTCLPKYMERSAYYLSFWKLGKYYRTYPTYVEDEVKQNMAKPSEQFEPGICNTFGSLDEKYASVCVDENYISARWPGDAKLFAKTILDKILEGRSTK